MLQSDIQNFYESQVFGKSSYADGSFTEMTLSYLTNKVDRDNNEARLTLKGEI